MSECLQELKKNRIISVLRTTTSEDTLEAIKACADAGISSVEILINKPHALDIIKEVSKDKTIIAGAGTVIDTQMAENAVNSGAKFIVSPHTDPDIISFCKERGVTVISGALTSSEIVNAWKKGADIVKIFPADVIGGPAYLRAVKKPLEFIEFMVTGGINLLNVSEYLRAGAALAGISSALFENPRGGIYKTVYRNARAIMDAID